MKLSDVTLLFVTPEEMDTLHDHWYFSGHKPRSRTYLRIIEPIRVDDYRFLLASFARDGRADYVAYAMDSVRHRIPARNVPWETIEEAVENIQRHPTKLGHVELCFRKLDRSQFATKIRFAEHESQIVGYEMHIAQNDNGLFKLPSRRYSRAEGYYGLWMPQEST